MPRYLVQARTLSLFGNGKWVSSSCTPCWFSLDVHKLCDNRGRANFLHRSADSSRDAGCAIVMTRMNVGAPKITPVPGLRTKQGSTHSGKREYHELESREARGFESIVYRYNVRGYRVSDSVISPPPLQAAINTARHSPLGVHVCFGATCSRCATHYDALGCTNQSNSKQTNPPPTAHDKSVPFIDFSSQAPRKK
jgi:hypothetical protein